MLTDSYNKVFKDKTKVLIVFSHPDDADFFASGTIARLVEDGKLVRVVKMTSGNKGSKQNDYDEKGLALEREKEDTTAMDILGVLPENNIYLRIGDGEVDNSLETISLIVNQIRKFKPDIVITHNPEVVVVEFGHGMSHVNHRDHRNTGTSVIDAIYPYSRDVLFFPKQLENPDAASHIVTQFLLTDSYNHPEEIFIDITKTYSKRVSALKSHTSQFGEVDIEAISAFYTQQEGSSQRWERFRFVNTAF